MSDERGEPGKLLIQSFTTDDRTSVPAGEFVAYFNPEEYSQVYDVEYDDSRGSGTTGSPMVFKRNKPRELEPGTKLLFPPLERGSDGE
jgi:hypothetical protein